MTESRRLFWTCTMLGLGLVLLPLTAGCTRRREVPAARPVPAPAAPGDGVAPSYSGRRRVVPAAPIVPTVKCSAVVRAAVHLRPAEQEKSAGPEFPAGTRLEVLAPGKLTRKGLNIYLARATATGTTGYVFLSGGELGPECPLVWPQPDDAKPNKPKDPKSGECIKAGWFKTRGQLIAKDCWNDESGSDRRTEPEASYKVDADGDGRTDELLELREREFVLALHTSRGWTGLLLGTPTHHDVCSWVTPVGAGSAVYLQLSCCQYCEDYNEGDEDLRTDSTSLLRVRPDGQVFSVLYIERPDRDENLPALTFHGNADGSVLVSDGKRSQMLRWDADRYRLVPL